MWKHSSELENGIFKRQHEQQDIFCIISAVKLLLHGRHVDHMLIADLKMVEDSNKPSPWTLQKFSAFTD